MSDKLKPMPLYRAFRDSRAGMIVNAILPIFPMAPMPTEGVKDPTSRVAQEYKRQIRENNDYHGMGVLAEGIVAAVVGTILGMKNPELFAPMTAIAIGYLNMHGVRAFVNEARYSYHEWRASVAYRRRKPLAVA